MIVTDDILYNVIALTINEPDRVGKSDSACAYQYGRPTATDHIPGGRRWPPEPLGPLPASVSQDCLSGPDGAVDNSSARPVNWVEANL